MPLVAPSVCRYNINARYGGEDVANVFDYRLVLDTAPDNRPDMLAEHAKKILDAWEDHVMPILSTEYLAVQVSWLDLDALDGSKGATQQGISRVWPDSGGLAGASMPGNVSLRCVKQGQYARDKRKGRTYLVGIQESWTAAGFPNTYNSDILDDAQLAMDGFLTATTQALATDPYLARMVVVHTVDDVYDGFSFVTGFTADSKVRRQGRRLAR